jgi:hypothetical protein
MAALDEVDVAHLQPETTQDLIKKSIATMFWMWYANNLDREVTTIKVWFIRKKVYVRELKSIFELLFGPA